MPEVPPLPGWDNQEHLQGDFPGDPVVKTLPSNAEGTGSIPGWEAKILHASARKQNNSNNKNKGSIATNSIKTFKMVHIKKKKKKKWWKRTSPYTAKCSLKGQNLPSLEPLVYDLISQRFRGQYFEIYFFSYLSIQSFTERSISP